jgi:RND family efflux transporter MFP subunit
MATLVVAFYMASPVCGQPQQPPAKVVTAPVTEKEVAATDRVIGVVDFDKVTTLSTQVEGMLSGLSVTEGQLVAKNAIIAQLDTQTLQKEVEILEAQISQVDVRIGNTKRNADRYEQLYQQKAASERTYQDLNDEYQALLAEKQALSKRIERIELDIRKSAIRAPFKGLVLTVKKYEGDWLSPGSAVCDLASTNDVVVKAAVSEELISFLKPGDALTLSIPALDRQLSGVLRPSAPVVDVKTKTFKIKLAIDYEKNLLQNMTAIVEVPVSDKAMRKIIRRAALVRANNQNFVYTVAEGKAKLIPIEIVGYDGEDMIVGDGAIQTGMPVVVDGNDRLRPDQPVAPVEKP